ncbi:hypothetical protein [Streptomyces sp. NBC_01092]|uniref:hypothetical protein n=1 Tax=Streptomyces sp. NBC_01092 TaxID=2903748 RepID=UPI00386976E9|nr:hypothetical protein OG254_48890 [Streptomyces sp. NBC_01092]
MSESNSRIVDFEAELSRLHLKRQAAEPERRLALAAALLVVTGLTLLIVAFVGTREAVTIQQQVDNLALAPLGLGVTVAGAALWLRYSLTRYLRFWLIRLIYEDRQNTDRILGTPPDDQT